MDDIAASALKTILHSKRANLYYLEHCRIQVHGGRVEYVTDEVNRSAYWNIPIANTTSVMLGTGTSITQAAMRELSKAGVMVGFCGGGGTPLFGATEVQWFSPQSEYRPTEYLQQWVSFWFDESQRLEAARAFQRVRIVQIQKHWLGAKMVKKGFVVDGSELCAALVRFDEAITQASSQSEILSHEARLTKSLYRFAVHAVEYGDFTRAKNGSGTDLANNFLDHGNYLAYGLGATSAWVLGIPHGLAVLHGKTRRGGLVFDIADLVKDALVLPNAFVSASIGEDNQKFRYRCLQAFRDADALDTQIDTLKDVAQALSKA